MRIFWTPIGIALIVAHAAVAQTPELTLGGPVTLERIPDRYKAGPTLSSLAALRAQISAAGDLTLDSAVFALQQGDTVKLTVRKLTLRRSSIVTNGGHLVITAEALASDAPSRITTFDDLNPDPAVTPAGQKDGVAGSGGRSAGTVEVYLTGSFLSPVLFDVEGEDGQDGGNGQPGAQGARGGRGRDARARHGFCRRGAGSGHRGGAGSAGGKGGDGGAGGAGGALNVNFINIPSTTANLRYELAGGAGGEAGIPGVGGPGGQGGPPGKNHNPCKTIDWFKQPRRGIGPQGPQGPGGAAGRAGSGGAQGTLTVTRLDLPPS